MFSSTKKRVDPLRLAISITLAVSSALAIFAACSSDSAAKTPMQRTAKPIFWQIDAPEVDGQPAPGRLYLLGSIHVGPKGGWELPASVVARFEASKALIVEVDMRSGKTPEEQDNAVLAHGLLPPGESLANHISAPTYAMLERYAEKSNRSLFDINPWQAWMVATMLLTFELERLGYPSEAALDVNLMARVTSRQPIIGLETIEEQLSLLSGMSPAHQELMLKDTLLQIDDIENYFDELKEGWRTGDEDRLESVLFRELEKTPELAPFYERVIYSRTTTMCDGFEKQLESGETLFGVVDVYHIVGARGVPACLAARGYTTVRLSASGAPFGAVAPSD
jgi:uncharacterized protein YbaP (TraB family)